MPLKSEEVTVSIFILTYNQKRYVSQMLDSILSQETDFLYKLVIGDDCSTDGTLDILLEYERKFPSKIEVHTSETNKGLIKNFERTLKFCQGKYIAICDGDDYWIDKRKLQEQVDFLTQNTEFKIVYTRRVNLLPDGSFEKDFKENENDITDFDNLIFENYIPSVTCLFKNTFDKSRFSSIIRDLPYGDWPLYLHVIVDDGKIFFLNKVTAVYRTGIGASAKLIKNLSNAHLVKLEILQRLLNSPNFFLRRDIIEKSISKANLDLMLAYNREKNYYLSFLTFSKLLRRNFSFQIVRMYLYSLYIKLNRK